MSIPLNPQQNIVVNKSMYSAVMSAVLPIYTQQMAMAHHGELEAKLNEMKMETQEQADKMAKSGVNPTAFIEQEQKKQMEYIKSQQVPFEELAMRALVEADDFAIKACPLLEKRHLQSGVIITDLALASG